jgi:hypothetical protein
MPMQISDRVRKMTRCVPKRMLKLNVMMGPSFYNDCAVMEWTGDCKDIKLRLHTDASTKEFWASESVQFGDFIACAYSACLDMVRLIYIDGDVNGDSISVKYECTRTGEENAWVFPFTTRRTEKCVENNTVGFPPAFQPVVIRCNMQKACSALISQAAAILEELRL